MLLSTTYSLAEANQLVPLLESSFARIAAEAARIQTARAAVVLPEAESEAAASARTVTEEAQAAIAEELGLLERLGALVHSMSPPTVHLLSHRGASQVLLSWRPGEPEFLYFHSLDWGFDERAPIDDPALFGGEVLPS